MPYPRPLRVDQANQPREPCGGLACRRASAVHASVVSGRRNLGEPCTEGDREGRGPSQWIQPGGKWEMAEPPCLGRFQRFVAVSGRVAVPRPIATALKQWVGRGGKPGSPAGDVWLVEGMRGGGVPPWSGTPAQLEGWGGARTEVECRTVLGRAGIFTGETGSAGWAEGWAPI